MSYGATDLQLLLLVRLETSDQRGKNDQLTSSKPGDLMVTVRVSPVMMITDRRRSGNGGSCPIKHYWQ